MKLIFSVIIGIAFKFSDTQSATIPIKFYASKYEHIDIEAILNNRRMVNYYSACLLSEGPCPPEGVDLKRILPEALQTNCYRCSEKQANVALRAIKRLKKEYPKIWNQLSKKWDPDGSYVKKFETTFGGKLISSQPYLETSTITDHKNDETSTETSISKDSASSSATHIMSFTNNKASSSSTSIKSTKIPSFPSTTSSSTIHTTTIKSYTTIKLPIPSLPQIVPGLLPINTFFTNPPIPIRPINIGATVSGLVRGLGLIGTRVVETGAEIAEVVIKNIARPLPLLKK